MTSYTKTIEKPEIILIAGPGYVRIDDVSLSLPKKRLDPFEAEELAATLQAAAAALRGAARAAQTLEDRRDADKAAYDSMLADARAAFGEDTRLVIKRGNRSVAMTVISPEWGEDELKGKDFDELKDELQSLIDCRKPDPDDDDDDGEASAPTKDSPHEVLLDRPVFNHEYPEEVDCEECEGRGWYYDADGRYKITCENCGGQGFHWEQR